MILPSSSARPDAEPRSRSNWQMLDMLDELSREAVGSCAIETPIDLTGDRCPVGIAKLCSRFDERVEHRLQIEGRAADNLKHIGGRGLLL